MRIEQLEESRFTRPAGPHEQHELALVDLEIDVREGGTAVIMFRDVKDLNHGGAMAETNG
jgi:hypothetical protein